MFPRFVSLLTPQPEDKRLGTTGRLFILSPTGSASTAFNR